MIGLPDTTSSALHRLRAAATRGVAGHVARLLTAVIVALLLMTNLLLAADTGTITGQLAGKPAAVKVVAVSRVDDQRYPGTFTSTTGRFQIAGLPLNKDLDCIVDYPDARLEGVNFNVRRSDYEEEQPLAPAAAQFIKERVLKMNVFEDIVEVLAVDGNIQHAAVLLNKVRTQPFINSQPGEIIWRTELWHYERPEEDWVRVQEDYNVLYRERLPRRQFEKKSLTFDPALGGLRLSAERPTFDLGEITPPPTAPGIHYRDRRKQPCKLSVVR